MTFVIAPTKVSEAFELTKKRRMIFRAALCITPYFHVKQAQSMVFIALLI